MSDRRRIITMSEQDLEGHLRQAHARGQAQAHMAGLARPQSAHHAAPFSAGGMFTEEHENAPDAPNGPQENIVTTRFATDDVLNMYNTGIPIKAASQKPSRSCDVIINIQTVGICRVELYANVPGVGRVFVDSAYPRGQAAQLVVPHQPSYARWVCAGRMSYPVMWEAVWYSNEAPGAYFPLAQNTMSLVLDEERLPPAPPGLGSSWWANALDSATPQDLTACPPSFTFEASAPLIFMRLGGLNTDTVGNTISLQYIPAPGGNDMQIGIGAGQSFETGDDTTQGFMPSTVDANVQIAVTNPPGKPMFVWAQVK